MKGEDWDKPRRAIGFLLGGDASLAVDSEGRPVEDDSLLVLINAGKEGETFVLPALEWGADWERVIDTANDGAGDGAHAGESVALAPLSLVLLRSRNVG
jgi:glycogen operon protein